MSLYEIACTAWWAGGIGAFLGMVVGYNVAYRELPKAERHPWRQ